MNAPLRADRDLAALRALARIMDDAVRIPGTRFRIGLDALVGLVPGVGDAATGLIAGYAILAAARAGAPPPLLARMAGNVLLDALAGAIPVLGDVFDIAWKANRRNVKLLERYLAQPADTARSSALYVAAVLVGLVLIVGAAVAGAIWIAMALLRALAAV